MTTPLTRFGVPLIFSLIAATVGCGATGKSAKSAAEASSEEAPDHAEVGKPAPDLTIHTLNGKGDISLSSLAGKTVIVDFWATWCGPCKQSFPKLEELQRSLGDGTVIVAVSVDDESSGILDFAKENGATFPIGWDEGHAIAGRWKVSTMPTTFIVDGSGVVRFVHAGYHDGETEHMAKEIAEISSDSGSRVAKRARKARKSEEAEVASNDDAKKAPEPAPAAPTAAAPPEEEEPAPPPRPTKKKAGKKAGKASKRTKKKA